MSEHYTDGRRWSHISNAWIFADSWNDREEIASLRAEVASLKEERDALLREDTIKANVNSQLFEQLAASQQSLADANNRVEMLEEWLRRYGADC